MSKHHSDSRGQTARWCAALIVLTAASAAAPGAPPLTPIATPLFSLDPGSPSLGGAVTADDVLSAGGGGPVINISGASLGLGASDDVNGLSRNNAEPAPTFTILFSVDRPTIGLSAPDAGLVAAGIPYNVADQAARRQSAADMFASTDPYSPTLRAPRGASTDNNYLALNQFDEGGTSYELEVEAAAAEYNLAPEGTSDNVDATMESAAARDLRGTGTEVYFTLTAGSPFSAGGAQASGANIYYNPDPSMSASSLYEDASTLGLMLTDDIDALVVVDQNSNGVFDGTDLIIFSLAPGSPSLSTLAGASSEGAAADVFRKRPTTAIEIVANAAQLGLGTTPDVDNIDALMIAESAARVLSAVDNGIRDVDGDCDNDGDVTLQDYANGMCLLTFSQCAGAPGVSFDSNGSVLHIVSANTCGFGPRQIVVERGDTVRWLWGTGSHNVISGRPGFPDGNFASGAPVSSPGTTFDVTFGTFFLSTNPMPANVYPYFCSAHAFCGMRGVVAVREHPCAEFDFGGDGDVDFVDFAEFSEK